MRKFEVVKNEFRKFPDGTVMLPERSTSGSAAYDFKSMEYKILHPKEQHIFWTDVKSYMFYDNVLKIYIRSSLAIKKKIRLANGVGIIDFDYADNSNNDGNIGICLINDGDTAYEINIGDKIAQGIYERFLITESDKFKNNKEKKERIGGFGSTGQ